MYVIIVYKLNNKSEISKFKCQYCSLTKECLCSFCTPFAVNPGRNDASGISGAFSAREQSFYTYMLQCFLVSCYAYRCRCAGFHSNHCRLVRQEPPAVFPE